MRHENSLGWLGTSVMWNSKGVSRDADDAAAPTISLIPALYLLVGPGMPLPNPACATTLTKADPVPAFPAHTNRGVTSPDVQQLTLGKSTLNLPVTERTNLNCLQALAIPPEDTPKYLSQLTPPTPIDINNFASFLHGHLDPTIVNHLLTVFSQGFKIDYTNLICANTNPSIIEKNMLKEVTLGHTAGPFRIPPSPTCRYTPLGSFPRNTFQTGVPFST